MIARTDIVAARLLGCSSQSQVQRAISGLDPQSFCLGIAGWNEWFLGYPDQALQAALQAVAVARSQGYPQSVDQALQAVAQTHLLRREPDAALGYIDLALAISREHGLSQRIAQLRLMLVGCCCLERTIRALSLSSRRG